jgi:hypothetical protein
VGGRAPRIDDLVVIPTTGSERRSDVNAASSIVVAEHINALLADAAAERLARSIKAESHQPNRLAGAARSVWSTLFGPADQQGSLPLLADYPYRG